MGKWAERLEARVWGLWGAEKGIGLDGKVGRGKGREIRSEPKRGLGGIGSGMGQVLRLVCRSLGAA